MLTSSKFFLPGDFTSVFSFALRDGVIADGNFILEETKEEEACIATTPVEASAEEEAAAVASTIGLPDSEYDSAIESDCESDLDFW